MVINTDINDVIQVVRFRLSIEEVELSVHDRTILWGSIWVHNLVITNLIKLIMAGIDSKVLECVNPILVIDQGIVIVLGGIPVKIAGKGNMWEGIPLIVSVGPHQNIGKAIANSDWDDVAVQSDHALKTAKGSV